MNVLYQYYGIAALNVSIYMQHQACPTCRSVCALLFSIMLKCGTCIALRQVGEDVHGHTDVYVHQMQDCNASVTATPEPSSSN